MSDTAAPHVRVEYDPDFDGGDYAGTGQFVLLPLDEVEAHGAEAAFTAKTGLPGSCMVHHTLDELFDAEGERLPEDGPGAPGM